MENYELPKKRELSDSPQYFGAYLNLARLNVFAISNHLSDEFKIGKKLRSDEYIPNSFLTREIKDNPNHIFSHLKRFLPIVRLFDPEIFLSTEERKTERGRVVLSQGKRFKELAKTLFNLFKDLNQFRNDYTHYFSTTKGTKRKLEVADLTKDFMNKAYAYGIEKSKKRFKNVIDADAFEGLKKTKLFIGETNKLNQIGLVFFICMFLDRESVFHFVNRVVGLKAAYKPEYKAKRELMAAFSVYLPQEKFFSDDPKLALNLDIMNELAKCPAPLYKVMTEDRKAEFQPTLDKEVKGKISDNSVSDSINSEDFEDYLKSITSKVRRSNRFPYFALRYIDDFDIFKDIRFQINLGKYQIYEYKKPFGGDKVERKVIENAKAFGKLYDFINKEGVLEGKINLKNLEKAHFEQFSPKYHISNNRIAFKILKKDKKESVPILISNEKKNNRVKNNLILNKLKGTTSFLSIHELNKILLLEYFEPGKAEQIIIEFIKTFNEKIKNPEFIEKIKSKLGFSKGYRRFEKAGIPQMSKYLKEIHTRKEKLDKILKDHNLTSNQIPTRILDYWLNIEDVKTIDRISNKIKQIKEETKNRLKKFDKGNIPKIGKMATYLAKDILDLIIDEEVKSKITSFYYDKMQECLALYANKEKRELFIDIVKNELNLFDKSTGHPFLSDLNFTKFTSTEEFYRAYLYKKVGSENHKNHSWLYKTFYKKEYSEDKGKYITNVKFPERGVPLKYLSWSKSNTEFEDWLNNLNTIYLPTNLFDAKLEEVLKAKLREDKIHFNESDNYSILLKKLVGKDKIQSFYDAKRHYVVYDKEVIFEMNSKDRFDDYFKPYAEEVLKDKNKNKKDVYRNFHKAISGNEKLIRILSEEDIGLTFVLRKAIKDDTIYPVNMNNLLNQQVELKEKIEDKYIVAKRKRKDYGIFRKLLFDKRIPDLLYYTDKEEIEYETLRKEIAEYNKVREGIFDTIFELEKKIVEKDKDGLEELFINDESTKSNRNISHKAYLQWLINHEIIDETQKEFLSNVRNKFSHNNVPLFDDLDCKLEDNNVISTIWEKYAKMVDGILEKIDL